MNTPISVFTEITKSYSCQPSNRCEHQVDDRRYGSGHRIWASWNGNNVVIMMPPGSFKVEWMQRVFSYDAARPTDASGWSLMGRMLIWATRNAEAEKAVEAAGLRREQRNSAELGKGAIVLAR